MNEAQQQALNECSEKLGEHFDAFVLVVTVEKDGNSPAFTSHQGGFHAAMGLLYDALDSYAYRRIGGTDEN